jgi:hypothetical protein
MEARAASIAAARRDLRCRSHEARHLSRGADAHATIAERRHGRPRLTASNPVLHRSRVLASTDSRPTDCQPWLAANGWPCWRRHAFAQRRPPTPGASVASPPAATSPPWPFPSKGRVRSSGRRRRASERRGAAINARRPVLGHRHPLCRLLRGQRSKPGGALPPRIDPVPAAAHPSRRAAAGALRWAGAARKRLRPGAVRRGDGRRRSSCRGSPSAPSPWRTAGVWRHSRPRPSTSRGPASPTAARSCAISPICACALRRPSANTSSRSARR